MPKTITTSNIKQDLDGKPLLTLSNEQVKFDQELYGKMDFEKNLNYFHIMGHEESHLVRRRQIIKAHPEIKCLYGPDITSLWVVIALCLAQFTSVRYCSELSWFWFIMTSHVISATISHSSQLLVHELTHFSCFENIFHNKLLAIVANLPTGFPSAITFGRYHADHHTYMNIKEKDPDLPSQAEIDFINTPFRKFCFILFQTFFYGLRPVLTFRKKLTQLEYLNLVVVIASDYLIYTYLGGNALFWIILGTITGMGLHPCAGHTIAEHYEFEHRLETYNYMGICNFFNLNVGYHTEHHDFPMIPWTRLPLVRKFAPEFYEHLPYHTSYVKVFMLYIFEGSVGPFSRIVRRVANLDSLTKTKE